MDKSETATGRFLQKKDEHILRSLITRTIVYICSYLVGLCFISLFKYTYIRTKGYKNLEVLILTVQRGKNYFLLRK